MTVTAPDDQYNWRLTPRTGAIAVPGDLIARYAAGSGEQHVVPSGSPYYVRSFLVPYVDDLATYPVEVWTTSDKSAGQLTKVAGAPAAGEFFVDATYNTALFEFNVAQAGTTIFIFYYGIGTPVCLPGVDSLYWGNVDDPSWLVRTHNQQQIAIRYTTSSDQDIITSTTTTIDFDLKYYDLYGSDRVTTGAAWVFTNNLDYDILIHFDVMITWEILTAVSTDSSFRLRAVNGATIICRDEEIFPFPTAPAAGEALQIGDTFTNHVSGDCLLASGATIHFDAWQDTGNTQRIQSALTALSPNGRNNCTIHAIGLYNPQ